MGTRAALAGAAAGGLGIVLAAQAATADAALAALVLAALVTVAVTDLERRLVPNKVVLPVAAAALGTNLGLHADRALEWPIAAVGAAAFFLAPNLVRRGAVGMGDVKLALLLGAALGSAVVGAVFIAAFAALPFAIAATFVRRTRRPETTLPFAPFLALGGVIMLLPQLLPPLGS